VTTPGPCPPARQIAAFVDGTLDPSERAAVARHVDECVACFDLVATLGNQASRRPPAVNTALRNAALAARQQPPVVRRLLPTAAAVAALLVAVVWWGSPRQPGRSDEGPGPQVTSPSDPESLSRSSSSGAVVVVQEPQEGDAVNGGQLVRWDGPAEAASYEVQVATTAGDVVFRRQVEGTVHQVRLDPSPKQAGTYYLWVAAYLPEGRRLTSNVVRVRVPPAR
jgi:anti-sigma factor RsiW